MRLPSLHFLSMKALSGKVFCNSTSKRIGNISTHFPEEQNKTQKLRWPSKVTLVDPVELRVNHLRGTLRAQLSSAAPPVQAMPGEAGECGSSYCCDPSLFSARRILTYLFSTITQRPSRNLRWVWRIIPEAGRTQPLGLGDALGETDYPRVCPRSCTSPSSQWGQTVHAWGTMALSHLVTP